MASIAQRQVGVVGQDGALLLRNKQTIQWLAPDYLKRQERLGLTEPGSFVGVFRKQEKPPELAKEK